MAEQDAELDSVDLGVELNKQIIVTAKPDNHDDSVVNIDIDIVKPSAKLGDMIR